MEKIIVVILLVNALTFIGARIWWALRGDLSANLLPHIGNPGDTAMDYLIAGNLNQADTAFDFMEPLLGANYTFVNFSNKGWSAGATADRITSDICKNGYHAGIFTISLGDHAARYLEKVLKKDVDVYAINPCPNRDVLQERWKRILQLAVPLAEIACHALGWISYLPIIPSFGGKYSLILLIDQYWCIYYDYPPMGASCTCGVVCSTEDTFLDNIAIKHFYLDAEIEEIGTPHSDIVKNSALYYQAMRNLLHKSTAP